ncbi:CD209 antigen-like protein C isoform X2 [Neoarius graeffei]|nr:CD209 antigen-like protein C isoform X2 [Neoarius graeffei]XP_060772617.1 CD209 antigen-like protein C isoform X2 [Neoarius graeffei]
MTAGGRCYIMAVACVLLLCFLLLIAATALWIKFSILNIEKDQLQNTYDTLIIEIDQLHTSYKKMAVEKSQLQRSYMKMTFERDHLRTRNNNLTKERAQQQAGMDQLQKEYDELQSNFSTLEMQEKLKWVDFGSSSYYISQKKNWTESRKDCKNRGADLVIIDSKDEQDFINTHLSKSTAWIGLTDLDNEGTWKWVDDTPLGTGYWRQEEPNNKGEEDCVLVTYPKNEQCWNDAKCFIEAPWICEKKGSV